MTNGIGQLLGGPTTTLLDPGEAIRMLVLGASFLFLFVTGILATGAVYFRRRMERRRRVSENRFRVWKEALHGILYDGSERETLWMLVDDRSALDFLHFLVEYVRRLQGDERAEICFLAEPHLARVVPYLRHRAEGRRMRAVQMLGELGLPRYADEVVAALDDPSPMVSMAAASTLARGRYARVRACGAGAIGSVLALAPGLPRRDGRVDAGGGGARAAGHAGGPGGAHSRPCGRGRCARGDPRPGCRGSGLRGARKHDDIELRAATIRLLANVGRAKHLDAVRRELTTEDLPVRLAAIRALGRFGLPVDLPPLEAAAREDPSPWVAIAAARALKEGGGDSFSCGWPGRITRERLWGCR